MARLTIVLFSTYLPNGFSQQGGGGVQAPETSPAPESAPLTPASVFAPATEGLRTSYLIPSFELTARADSNPGASSNTQVVGYGSLLGNIELRKSARTSQFDLDYVGGGFFSTGGNQNSTFHSMSVMEKGSYKRFQVQAGDILSYLPESSFGFAGFDGLSGIGQGLGGGLGGGMGGGGGILGTSGGVSPFLLPGQTLLTGQARQLSNAALLQLGYPVGRNAVLTGTAVYGTLHFFGNSFSNSDYGVVIAGYTRNITSRNFIGVNYMDWSINSGAGPAGSGRYRIHYQNAQLSYGHRVGRRLALELSGGPGKSTITPPSTSSSTRPVNSTSLFTYDSIEYRARRTTANLFFVSQVTGGAGVLPGAQSNWANGSVTRQMSRRTSVTFQVGAAYNKSLNSNATVATPASGCNAGGTGCSFKSWDIGAGFRRELTRQLELFLSYHLEGQNSNTPVCVGGTCSTSIQRHVVDIGLDWHGWQKRL